MNTAAPEISTPPSGRSRQVFFQQRPQGEPESSVFGVREHAVPTPADGELLCRNLLLSVDPYLRLKMYSRESYTLPLEIGQAIPGGSIAQVVTSRAEGWSRGQLVAISGGWQDYAVVSASTAKRVDLSAAPDTAWLGALGMTGLTAYVGLKDIGRPVQGETLVVSAAAGAVGSVVGQIARIMGCRVVGIAGTARKCDFVRDTLGFDACVDYKSPNWEAHLRQVCPRGVDVYFDNVGGAVSAAVFPLLNEFARVPVCGLISQYNGQSASASNTLDEWMRWVLVRRLTVRGFIVSDLARAYPEFTQHMAEWMRESRVRGHEQVHSGFENIVQAFLGMLRGDNLGKTLVRIAHPVLP